MDIQFRDDVLVVLDEASQKSDRGIARRAWAIHPDRYAEGRKDSPEGWSRVITAMLRGRHGSPFEGGYLSVYVEAPVVVWWEWTRHRFMSLGCPDLAFNLESGRYKVLDGVFYLPPVGRPCKEPDGFKPIRPNLEDNNYCFNISRDMLRESYEKSWSNYQEMINKGVAREVARLCLGFGVYYAGYVSANPRTWLNFFSLRRQVEAATFQTFPQWEIQQADVQCEEIFAHSWPITYQLFNDLGRVAP